MSALALGTGNAGNSVVAGTTQSTTNFTPAGAGNLVLISVVYTSTTSTANLPTSDTLANVKHVTNLAMSAGTRINVFAAVSVAGTDTIDFTFTTSTTGAAWRVQEILNADMTRGYWSPFHAGVQGLVTQVTNTGTGNTGSVTFPRAQQHTSNAFFTFHGCNNSSGGAPEAGWTEFADQNTPSAPFLNIEGQWRIGTTDLTNTVTFTGSPGWGSVGVEVWGEDGSGDWLANETFTKADGTGWTGDQPWTITSNGSLRTISNRAVSDNATSILGRMDIDSSSPNHEAVVQAVNMELGTISFVGLRLRYDASGSDDGYEFLRVGAASLSAFTVTLRKWVSTNVTSLGNLTIPRAALDTPETLFFTAIGNTLTCYLDGVQVLAATDTSFPTKLRTGLTIRGSATGLTTADNFAAGDIGKARPKVTLLATVPTSSKATASLGVKKKLIAKAATGSSAKAILFGRVARYQARLPQSTAANAYTLLTAVEAFNIKRPLIAKVPTSSSAKANLETGSKKFQARANITFDSGGIFAGAVLDVAKAIVESAWPIANNAEGTVQRGVGFAGTMFQSSSALGNVTGRTGFDVNVPSVFSTTSYLTGRIPYFVDLAISAGVVADFVIATPIFYLHCPLEYDVPAVLPSTKGPARALFKFYATRPSGVNVFIYSDGTISTVEPDGYSTLWKESDRTGDTLPDAVHVRRVFWGGHEAEALTNDEANALRDAGYDVRSYA